MALAQLTQQECTDDPTLSGLQRKAEQVRSASLKSKEAQQVKLAEWVSLRVINK